MWEKNRRLVATQSDSRKVYLWDLVSQGSVKDKVKMAASTPDLILEGHEAVADYALAWSTTAPIIASGGKDKKILLWNIDNFLKQKGIHGESSSSSGSGSSSAENTGSKPPRTSKSRRLLVRASPDDLDNENSDSGDDEALVESSASVHSLDARDEESKDRDRRNASSDSNNECSNMHQSGSKLKQRRNKRKMTEPSR